MFSSVQSLYLAQHGHLVPETQGTSELYGLRTSHCPRNIPRKEQLKGICLVKGTNILSQVFQHYPRPALCPSRPSLVPVCVTRLVQALPPPHPSKTTLGLHKVANSANLIKRGQTKLV